MATCDLSESIPFKHHITLPDGVRIPVLHPDQIMGDDLPDKVETIDELRQHCVLFVAEKHRPMIEGLTGAQLMVLRSSYLGWQHEYYESVAIKAHAAARAERQPSTPQTTSPTPARQVRASAPSASSKPRKGHPIMPGQPLPGILGGHRWGADRGDDEGEVKVELPPIGGVRRRVASKE